MRKKYLYSNYSAPRASVRADIVSALFAEYYFGIERTVNIVDVFIAARVKTIAVFLLSFIISVVSMSLGVAIIAAATSVTALIVFGYIVVQWVSFKTMFRELQDAPL